MLPGRDPAHRRLLPESPLFLRACFVELKVEIALYALVYEKSLAYWPQIKNGSTCALAYPICLTAVRPRAYSLHDILDAVFYVLRSGCP